MFQAKTEDAQNKSKGDSSRNLQAIDILVNFNQFHNNKSILNYQEWQKEILFL